MRRTFAQIRHLVSVAVLAALAGCAGTADSQGIRAHFDGIGPRRLYVAPVQNDSTMPVVLAVAPQNWTLVPRDADADYVLRVHPLLFADGGKMSQARELYEAGPRHWAANDVLDFTFSPFHGNCGGCGQVNVTGSGRDGWAVVAAAVVWMGIGVTVAGVTAAGEFSYAKVDELLKTHAVTGNLYALVADVDIDRVSYQTIQSGIDGTRLLIAVAGPDLSEADAQRLISDRLNTILTRIFRPTPANSALAAPLANQPGPQ